MVDSIGYTDFCGMGCWLALLLSYIFVYMDQEERRKKVEFEVGRIEFNNRPELGSFLIDVQYDFQGTRKDDKLLLSTRGKPGDQALFYGIGLKDHLIKTGFDACRDIDFLVSVIKDNPEY